MYFVSRDYVIRFIFVISTCMILSSCSVIRTLVNDPSREEGVSYQDIAGNRKLLAYTLNQTADRRNVIFRILENKNDTNEKPSVVVCAEQPPDIAIAHSGESELKGPITIGQISSSELKFSDNFGESLLNLSSRSSVVEIFRLLAFNNCLIYMNSPSMVKEYNENFKILLDIFKTYSEKVADESPPNPPNRTITSPVPGVGLSGSGAG